MKKINYWLIGSLIAFAACTDLEVEEKDSLVVESGGEFSGVSPTEALNTAYGDIRGTFEPQDNLYALTEVTSDELLVPTRGTDWGDNGIWRTLHTHTWDPTHQYVFNVWNGLNSNVYRLNEILHPASLAKAARPGLRDSVAAQAKFLRAFNMFYILDLYRQIPFRTPDEGADVDPIVMLPAESIPFILKDLEEAEALLPDAVVLDNDVKLRGTKSAAQFLRAKLYLNKHVYLGTDAASADMDEVIANVDMIAAAGFALEDDYFNIFTASPDTETIFWTNASVGNKIWNGLHYNQPTPDNTGGGWNGFSTTAEFYQLFEGDQDSNEPGNNQEERRGYVPTMGHGYGFLVGQQYGLNGEILKDRQGNNLIFTPDFPGLTGNNETHGIRVLKYNPANGAYTGHLIIFRYGDAHLMKAEALFRKGDNAGALALVNELRAMREATPLGALDEQELLDERGRELYIEGWRRNDQVRFGKFDDPFPLKTNTDTFRDIFPIPQQALASNPNLVQNPGY
jgi:starch-binding outer membrane protein, SusD/RagB family